MKTIFCISLTVCLIACSWPSSALGQKQRSPKLRDDIELPADYSLDFQLGGSARSSIRGSNSLVVGTPLNDVGMEVFRHLISSPSIAALGRPYQWNLSVLNNDVLNAQSSPDGEIFVEGRLARLIGTNRGLWAAVLSHEVEHVAQRHWVKKYLYELYISELLQYWQTRARLGDNSANWALVGLRISAPIAAAKLSRNLEHDADIKGMMLMAEAGYHPDYVFALHHLMLMNTGDQSHLAAFFSTDPRWETRDQRDDKAYATALAEYSRRWPDPTLSSGGQAPEVVFVGKPEARENKKDGTADLVLPMYCRNTKDALSLTVHFTKDKQWLKSEDSQYRDSGGNLEFQQEVKCTEEASLNLQLPATMVPEENRKTTAYVEVLDSTGATVGRFKSFEVNFPKPNGKSCGVALASHTAPVTPQAVSTTPTKAPSKPLQTESQVRAQVSASAQSPLPALTPARTPNVQDSATAFSLAPNATAQPEVSESDGPGWIGIAMKDDAQGVVVTRVIEGSSAAEAGLRVGDVIYELNVTPAASAMRFDVAITRSRPGSRIQVGYIRGGMKGEVTLTVQRFGLLK